MMTEKQRHFDAVQVDATRVKHTQSCVQSDEKLSPLVWSSPLLLHTGSCTVSRYTPAN